MSTYGCSFEEIGGLYYCNEEDIANKLETIRLRQARQWGGQGGTTAVGYCTGNHNKACIERIKKIGFKKVHSFPGTHNTGVGFYIFDLKVDVPIAEQIKGVK